MPTGTPDRSLDEAIRHLYRRILAATGVDELVTDESLIDVGDPADALFWLLASVAKEGRRIPADLADEVVTVAESLIERGRHLDAEDGANLRDAANVLRATTDGGQRPRNGPAVGSAGRPGACPGS